MGLRLIPNQFDFSCCFAVERSSHFPDMFDFQTFLQNVLMSDNFDMGMWHELSKHCSKYGILCNIKLTDLKSDELNFA